MRWNGLAFQMSDETDSRTLLGGYVVSDTPGEFSWRPGVLTEAVSKGQWVLLEDIEQAGDDVIALLSSLVKTER